MDTVQRLDTAGSIAGSSPWIERAMQADVTPTPCPSLCTSTSPSLVKRAGTDVSCVLSQTFDVQSCHSSDIQRSEKSMRSAFHSDQHQDSTVDTDLCTDDDDLETTPVDEKRKKRFVSFLPASWRFGVAVRKKLGLIFGHPNPRNIDSVWNGGQDAIQPSISTTVQAKTTRAA